MNTGVPLIDSGLQGRKPEVAAQAAANEAQQTAAEAAATALSNLAAPAA